MKRSKKLLEPTIIFILVTLLILLADNQIGDIASVIMPTAVQVDGITKVKDTVGGIFISQDTLTELKISITILRILLVGTSFGFLLAFALKYRKRYSRAIMDNFESFKK